MNLTVEERTPIGFEQMTVSSVALPLTATTYNRDGIVADLAVITVETDAVRYRVDGAAPTASVGHQIAANGNVTVYGINNIRRIQLIRVTTDATVFVTYYRRGDS